jgi:hypothetical protein
MLAQSSSITRHFSPYQKVKIAPQFFQLIYAALFVPPQSAFKKYLSDCGTKKSGSAKCKTWHLPTKHYFQLCPASYRSEPGAVIPNPHVMSAPGIFTKRLLQRRKRCPCFSNITKLKHRTF